MRHLSNKLRFEWYIRVIGIQGTVWLIRGTFLHKLLASCLTKLPDKHLRKIRCTCWKLHRSTQCTIMTYCQRMLCDERNYLCHTHFWFCHNDGTPWYDIYKDSSFLELLTNFIFILLDPSSRKRWLIIESWIVDFRETVTLIRS